MIFRSAGRASPRPSGSSKAAGCTDGRRAGPKGKELSHRDRHRGIRTTPIGREAFQRSSTDAGPPTTRSTSFGFLCRLVDSAALGARKRSPAWGSSGTDGAAGLAGLLRPRTGLHRGGASSAPERHLWLSWPLGITRSFHCAIGSCWCNGSSSAKAEPPSVDCWHVIAGVGIGL